MLLRIRAGFAPGRRPVGALAGARVLAAHVGAAVRVPSALRGQGPAVGHAGDRVGYAGRALLLQERGEGGGARDIKSAPLVPSAAATPRGDSGAGAPGGSPSVARQKRWCRPRYCGSHRAPGRETTGGEASGRRPVAAGRTSGRRGRGCRRSESLSASLTKERVVLPLKSEAIPLVPLPLRACKSIVRGPVAGNVHGKGRGDLRGLDVSQYARLGWRGRPRRRWCRTTACRRTRSRSPSATLKTRERRRSAGTSPPPAGIPTGRR